MLKLSDETCQKNITVLQEKFPEICTWLKSQPRPGKVELIYTLSGLPDLRVETDAGKNVGVYNHDDPIQHIRRDLLNREFLKKDATFIFGLGLGYKVRQILEKMEEGHLLFVIEENPSIFQLALGFHDFSEAVRQGRLIFCTPEEGRIRQRIEQQGVRLLDGKITLEMEKFAPEISPLYSSWYESSQRLCNILTLTYKTFVDLSDTFMTNELKNIPKAIPGFLTDGFCKGDFSHIPAILVATGPSLQKNIHLLHKAKGKAVIIAVGQALRVLLAYDIVPDIICSIDFGESNYLDLEDVILDATMPLLIDNRVYPRILLEYQGNLIVPVSSSDILFQARSDHKENVDRGKTVAQLCLNLALAMGADPIVFIGQDLAVGETSHISGAIAKTKVEIRDNQIIQQARYNTFANEACWVDGIYGGKVPTTRVLMGYLEEFEKTIKSFPDRRFIDATEGGARIKGTEVMPLREVLDHYCQQEKDIDHLINQALTPFDPDLEKLISDLESADLLLRKILHIDKKLENPLKIMKKLIPAGEEEAFPESRRKRFEELRQRVNHGFEQIGKAIDSHRITQISLSKVKHALMQKENIYEADDSLYKKARITLNRYELAYKGHGEVIPKVKEALDEALSLLKEYRRLKDQESGPSGQRADFHFRMGICLKNMGYLRRAIREFEKSVAGCGLQVAGSPGHELQVAGCGLAKPLTSNGSSYSRHATCEESFRQLAEIYLTLEQFDQAETCLKQIHCHRELLQSGSLPGLPNPSDPPGSLPQGAFPKHLSANSQGEEKIQKKILASKEKCLERYMAKALDQSQAGDFVNAIIYARKVLAMRDQHSFHPESNQEKHILARDILEKSLEQRRQKILSTQEEDRKFEEECKRKQEVRRYLAEAGKLVQENAFDKAINAYQEILADHQDHPEVHFGLSRAYQGQSNWESALKELQWLAERYPHKPRIHADLGDVYLSISRTGFREGDAPSASCLQESFKAYKKAIEVDKKFIHLYLKMATICIHLGKLDEAIRHYEDYLNLNPGDYHSLVKLGDCYLLMGARDAAKIGYQAALRIQPNYSPAMERINRLFLSM